MKPTTATQPIIAPDRVPLRSFLAALHAAGEFGRCVVAPSVHVSHNCIMRNTLARFINQIWFMLSVTLLIVALFAGGSFYLSKVLPTLLLLSCLAIIGFVAVHIAFGDL